MMRTLLIALSVFVLAACSSDGADNNANNANNQNNQNNANNVDEELTWPEYTFDAQEPTATAPARADWETATLPMDVTGTDNGDGSILYSLALGHYWLVKNQFESGDYLYEWLADTDEELDSTSRLQMHAVAWSQVLLYRFLERDEFLIAAYRVAKKYINDLRQDTLADGTPIQSLGGRLNSTAFYFFLLIELEDVLQEGEFTDAVNEMAEYFANQVGEEGCIYETYPQAETCVPGLNDDGNPDFNAFAVGQGMVAMERMYRFTGEERWLDLIEKAANYYYELNEGAAKSVGGLYWSAWAGPPMVSLVLERPNETIEEWIYAQADLWVTDQYGEDADPAYVGGFKKNSGRIPTWSAVSEVELIVDAYRLAKARGDEERMKTYKNSGILAAGYLLSLQYRADNVEDFDLANPDRAIGAFHFSNDPDASSISMHHVRADYMDHMAVTLLKMITYLELPETYPGTGFAKKSGE